LPGLDLLGVLLGEVAHRDDVGVAEERVVVEVHLGVERETSPPSVTTSGLISQRAVQSREAARQGGDQLHAALGGVRPPARAAGEAPRLERRARGAGGRAPSGSSPASRAATSSMSMPPSVEAIITGMPAARSRVTQVELAAMSSAASTTPPHESWPSGPVWWVTSVHAEDLARAASASSASRTSLTPPPLPRPPAWICALTTARAPPERLLGGRTRAVGDRTP
jgi:hypothetical protein